MTDVERFKASMTTLMRDGRALVLKRGAAELPIRVVAGKTADRPDGLRADVTKDPGFVVAASEATIQLDASRLEPAKLAAVHEVLDEAARDFDWIGYSHMGPFDRAAFEREPTLLLTFSSAAKGAGVLVELLEALGIPPGEVTTS